MSDKITIRRWHIAEELKTDEDICYYLSSILEDAEDDPAFVAAALGEIAKARGMSKIAEEAGLGRESLYKALSGNGNPSFGTILKVVRALGFSLDIKPALKHA